MRNRKDYYKTLGVRREADEAEISSAFYLLVQKYHPDLCRDENVSDHHIRDINEAYEVLSDASKRRDYDRAYRSTVHVQVHQPSAERARLNPSGLTAKEPGITAHLPVTPEEARYGSSCEISISVSMGCPDCQQGAYTQDQTCKACNGTGRTQAHRTIRVPIPAGISDGDLIRLPGMGPVTNDRSRPRDVVLTVQVRPYL